MKTSALMARLLVNPCQAGRWWLSLPQGEKLADWTDLLAVEAQKNWPGKVAVLDDAATLISNLRVWENLILPSWRRDGGRLASMEEAVAAAFDLARMDVDQREKWVTRLPSMLDKNERRLVVLLRAVLIDPTCVIIEGECWRELNALDQESGLGCLFARLQQASCVIVLGSASAQAGYAPVNVEGDK